MEVLFYLFSIIAIISTIGVVVNIYPIYALLSLVVSFLSISCIFFILGAYLAGALEIIIYAGAIVVLFVFVIMMLNVDFVNVYKTINYDLDILLNFRKLSFLFVFLVIFLCVIWFVNIDVDSNHCCVSDCTNNIQSHVFSLETIVCVLFGPYFIVVEMASMLLLGALLVAFHLGNINISLCINSNNDMKE